MERFDHVTLIFSMPRSRSQWFRWFLSSGCEAWHDPLVECSKPQDLINKIVKWSKAHPGSRLAVVDTGAIFFFDHLVTGMPGLKVMFLFRHLADIGASLKRQLGQDMTQVVLDQQVRMFCRAYGQSPALQRLHYNALPARKLQQVYIDITGRAIDIETVEEMSAVKIDVPMLQQKADPRATRMLLKHVEAPPCL